eukprot:SAG31_NODE_129_length_23447_cov_5.010922_14_plen_121_part_00
MVVGLSAEEALEAARVREMDDDADRSNVDSGDSGGPFGEGNPDMHSLERGTSEISPMFVGLLWVAVILAVILVVLSRKQDGQQASTANKSGSGAGASVTIPSAVHESSRTMFHDFILNVP